MMNHAFFFYILVYVLNLNFEAFVISIDIRSQNPDREKSSGQYVMVDTVNNRPAYKVSFVIPLNDTNSRF